jgi:hypothetical protein
LFKQIISLIMLGGGLFVVLSKSYLNRVLANGPFPTVAKNRLCRYRTEVIRNHPTLFLSPMS